MVRESILTPILKRLIVPYSVVTTASLIFTFNSAKAATVSDIVFQKQGMLTHGMKSGISLTELPKQAIHNLDIITGHIMKWLDWYNNLQGSLPKLTADLLTSIFHFLSKIILTTPMFIFNNSYLKNTSLTFALVSITLVTLFTVFESFMQMCKKDHTDFKKIIKRWAIVAGVSGFMPFAFETGFTYLNKLTNAITSMGMNGGNPSGYIYNEQYGFFDTLILILFDLTAIALLIPVCLQTGKRWWDLMCLACISPLALSASIFDRHKHYFNTWWSKVKSLSLVQLVYAVFLLLMGIFIFSTQSVQGGIFTLIVKLLIVVGGLLRMANPPRIVSNMTGDKADIFDQWDEGKGTLKDIYNTLTFKNFRPRVFFQKKAENKIKKVAALRKKSGRRYVDDLL
jgi:hypothetical protein